MGLAGIIAFVVAILSINGHVDSGHPRKSRVARTQIRVMNEVLFPRAALDEQPFPSSTNADVTKVLEGGNSLKEIYLPEGFCEKNKKGEMVDPWGRPFVFTREGDRIFAKAADPSLLSQ